MRNKREYAKTNNSVGRAEEERSARRMQLRHWLILGVGAAGAAGALAKWALAARHDAAHPPRQDGALPDDFLMSPLPPKPEPTLLVPRVGMPDSATPSNDARTVLVTPEADLPAQIENARTMGENTPERAGPSVPASPPNVFTATDSNTGQVVPQATSAGAGSASGSKTSKEKNSRGKKMDASSPKRSKLSQDYDRALEAGAMQASSLPSVGHEGEHLNRAPEGKSEATEEPASALGGQAESKLAVGEELRDREFPVPLQDTGAASQNRVVDQEAMSDEGPRMGDPLGTIPGDRQNSGKVGDILDQQAQRPDLVQQR